MTENARMAIHAGIREKKPFIYITYQHGFRTDPLLFIPTLFSAGMITDSLQARKSILVFRPYLVFPYMIFRERLTAPGLLLCPLLGGRRPEGIVGGKAERHESE